MPVVELPSAPVTRFMYVGSVLQSHIRTYVHTYIVCFQLKIGYIALLILITNHFAVT